jgi:ABC-type nitrate/sulfonate/bicarbonate transport system ATPase subunit
MQTAGVANLLELRIDAKVYRSAANVPIDVLGEIALDLAPASFTALTGPSGTGKSTLLRIAAGLDRDFRGTRRLAPSRRIAMVFQEPRLLPWRTVDDNIRIVLEAASVDADIGGWLERFDLRGCRRQYAGELSLGQARRVAMIRAMAVEPDLLLLDEPLVSLDQAVSIRLRAELRALAERGKTATLLVTHDLAEAIELADRVLFLGGQPARIVRDRAVTLPHGRRDRDAVAELVRNFSADPGPS